MSKPRVAVLFGGKSAEHQISLLSAKNIIEALPRDKYEVVLIGIDQKGKWYLQDEAHYLLHEHNPKEIYFSNTKELITLEQGNIQSLREAKNLGNIDIAFPILHGTFGEDGCTQGLLKLANIPFVGPSVLGSAVAMDKDIAKCLLKNAGIQVAPGKTLRKHEICNIQEILSDLGTPLFIKPANCGSSVGVSKANTSEELEKAIIKAFSYDQKILIESAIVGREIECAVLGNMDSLKASRCGEVLPQGDHEFYDYEAKYIDAEGAGIEIPASITPEEEERIQEIAIKTCRALDIEGMARVDVFLTEKGEIIVNEVNTLPGFTNISMYPKLWEISGLPYSDLLDQLLQLAVQRWKREKEVEKSFS